LGDGLPKGTPGRPSFKII